MHDKELSIIHELMEKLCEEMEYGEDDFADRLGKKKPEAMVIKMESKEEMPGEMMAEESEDPDDKLKERLMRLRG